MTSRLPGSVCCAAAGLQLSSRNALRLRKPAFLPLRYQHSAKNTAVTRPPKSEDWSAKSALLAIETRTIRDPLNAPRSSLPAPIVHPVRSEAPSTATYLWRVSKSYAGFYKEGIKAVWFNFRASGLLRERITKELGAKDVNDAGQRQLITRAEWQMLARNNHDMGKLPLFGVLVLIFGEWLAAIVPFIPAAVPGTCRIPKQVAEMRRTAEARRQMSFRRGISEPTLDSLPELEQTIATWPVTDASQVRKLLNALGPEQVHHLSLALNVHNRLWDWIQLPPPTSLLRRALTKKLQYLAIDDRLLLRGANNSEQVVTRSLNNEELAIACEERGLDVSGWPDATIRENLAWWLKHQKEDQGRGKALLTMLFRRPRAWATKAGLQSSKKAA